MQLRDITSHLNRLKRLLFHVCIHTDSFKRSVVPRVLPFVIRFFFNLGFDLFSNLLWTADNFGWRCFTFLLRQSVSTALFHIGKKRQGWSNKTNWHYADMCKLQNWLSPFITSALLERLKCHRKEHGTAALTEARHEMFKPVLWEVFKYHSL